MCLKGLFVCEGEKLIGMCLKGLFVCEGEKLIGMCDIRPHKKAFER